MRHFSDHLSFAGDIPIDFVSPRSPKKDHAHGGLRDRVDLTFDRRSGQPKLGLFNRFRTGIVDLQGCPQLSPALESWLYEFRRFDFPIERGSIRLRVSPQGKRGVWLDFANLDVKKLLDERSLLKSLMGLAWVEIGQRRKFLHATDDDSLKLTDPVLQPWFETYLEEQNGEKTIPLYSTVGSFTQPGFEANRALIHVVRKHILAVGAKRVIEFGSGIGNFTLPLMSMAEHVDAYEVDELALRGLRHSMQEAGLSDERITIHSGNFQVTRREQVEFLGRDLIIVDPPRSGLLKLLDPLEASQAVERPANFIYVSCYAESLAADARRLMAMGYKVTSATLLDQFPDTSHYEAVVTFRR